MSHEYKGITGKQLDDYFRAKGIDDNCPACGKKGSLATPVVIEAEEEPQGIHPAVRVVQTLYDNPKLGYGQYFQVCKNCGFLRYFRDIEVLAFFDEDNHNDQ